jgi:hypothetical protein
MLCHVNLLASVFSSAASDVTSVRNVLNVESTAAIACIGPLFNNPSTVDISVLIFPGKLNTENSLEKSLIVFLLSGQTRAETVLFPL